MVIISKGTAATYFNIASYTISETIASTSVFLDFNILKGTSKHLIVTRLKVATL